MLFYLILFLILFYFKLARVHKKEEQLTGFFLLQHAVIAISTLFLYRYGFLHFSLWSIAFFTFLFFILSALIVTAVQIGVFVEGKPLFGMDLLFKLMPFLTGVIVVFLWTLFL